MERIPPVLDVNGTNVCEREKDVACPTSSPWTAESDLATHIRDAGHKPAFKKWRMTVFTPVAERENPVY